VANHFAQGGVLAAHLSQVAKAKFVKPKNVRLQGTIYESMDISAQFHRSDDPVWSAASR
jgi:hypothetical protein